MSYLEQMLSLLTSAYNDMLESNIGKLFSFAGNAFDEVDENLRRIKEWRGVENACGRTLDRIGRNYGVPRNGVADNMYRLLIKLKMTSQISGGDVDTIISAVATIFGSEPELIELREVFPAKIEIEAPAEIIVKNGVSDLAQYVAMIKRLVAAGVGVGFFAGIKTETQVYVATHLQGEPTVYLTTDFRYDESERPLDEGVFAASALYGTPEVSLFTNAIQPITDVEIGKPTFVYPQPDGNIRFDLSTG